MNSPCTPGRGELWFTRWCQQYIACGLEYVDHQVSGLLTEVDDACALSAAPKLLVSDHALRCSLGKAGRIRVADHNLERFWLPGKNAGIEIGNLIKQRDLIAFNKASRSEQLGVKNYRE